jgi:hypothetical protein
MVKDLENLAYCIQGYEQTGKKREKSEIKNIAKL